MSPSLCVNLFSFSYSYSGIPRDQNGHGGGFVFDCRCLPNPGRFPQYADLTGNDPEVIDFLQQRREVALFLKAVFAIVDMAVKNYQERGFTSLMVSFGCTGGRHRSVYCVERLAQHLIKRSVKISVSHCMVEG